MKKILRSSTLVFITLLALMQGGCTPKNITYIQDLDESVILENAERKAMRVQPSDKLSIIVHSKDPELAALFNLPVVSRSTNSLNSSLSSGSGTMQRNYNAGEGMSSYTVSPEGNIEFPVLGKLHIEGMTRNEVSAFIKGELIGRNLVKDPTVVVEFLNTGVSVLGEVRTPGRYDMNRDNITVVEAIALAGDLTINGVRENVKVIREEQDGKLRVYQLDMTKGAQLLESPAYYLKQNDIIYVEPNDKRKRDVTVNGNTALSASFWISAASFVSSIAVLIVNLATK